MKKVGDYTLIKLLGKGSFGATYLTQKGADPIILATKVLERKKMEKGSLKKYLENEIQILKELDHPNIVKFYDFLASNSNYYLIMEFCNGGDLTGCLQKYKNLYKEPFNIEIVQYLMRQIIDALAYIHSKKIIHRDLKLDNILLSFENETDKQNLNLLSSKIKIIDFGLATKLDPLNLAYSVLGSPINMDPLILKKYDKAGGFKVVQGYNDKADIWSLGTVFYQLLTGEVLFQVNGMKELMKKVEEGNYIIPINKNFYKEVVSFLNCMLQYNPDDRFSINELAKHDFIVKNVSEFTQADLNQIFNKIHRGGLVINVKENETIKQVFNINTNTNNNNMNQINNENQAYIRRYNKLPTEKGYTHVGNIYALTQDYNSPYNKRKYEDMNTGNIIKIPINLNKHMKKDHRFTEGFVSPPKNNNIKYGINKIEKEMDEEKRLEYQNYEKKFMEQQKIEKEREEKERWEKEQREKEKKDNWNKGKEEIKKYINGLLNEYKSAKDYFIKNESKAKEEDANNKISQIEANINNFEQGYSIYYDTLPKPIDPEYIYNCSIEKRNNIFQIVISKYKEDKKELEDNIKQEILNYKKLDNKEFALIKNKVMQKLASEKAKLDKLKKIIELFQERYNNKWTPAPEISEELENENSQRKSISNPDYKLVIHTSKTNYNDSNLVLKLSMKINEMKIFSGEVNILHYGDFEEDITWNLSQNEFNNLSNNIILVKCYSNKLYQGSFKINISQLKTDKEMNISYPILLSKQSEQTIINFNIKIIIPQNNKQVSNGLKKVIKVIKIYPAFEGKSPDTNEIPSLFQNVK